MNLLRLHAFTGEDRYRRRADEVLAAFSALVERAAPAFPRLLGALDFASDSPREIVLSGTAGHADFEHLRAAVFASPKLNRVLAQAAPGAPPELASLVEGRVAEGGTAARAYVCENFACRAPIADPAALAALLEANDAPRA